MLVLNTRWNTYLHLPCLQKNTNNTVPIVHLANANLPAPPSTWHTAPLLLLLVVADRVRDLENRPLIQNDFFWNLNSENVDVWVADLCVQAASVVICSCVRSRDLWVVSLPFAERDRLLPTTQAVPCEENISIQFCLLYLLVMKRKTSNGAKCRKTFFSETQEPLIWPALKVKVDVEQVRVTIVLLIQDRSYSASLPWLCRCTPWCCIDSCPLPLNGISPPEYDQSATFFVINMNWYIQFLWGRFQNSGIVQLNRLNDLFTERK